MRPLRSPLALLWLALLSNLCALPAHALCRQCDGSLRCVIAPDGAQLCLESPAVCALLLPCRAALPQDTDPTGDAILSYAVFETTRPAGRALPGPIVAGEAWRARLGVAAPGARLLDAGLAHGGRYALRFETRQGDGFVVRRDAARALLEVCALESGRTGRVVASSTDGEETLLAPVSVEGRTVLLALQAGRSSAGVLAHLRRDLDACGSRLPRAPGERLFEWRTE
jgi:hypothetical protein